ncbi:MAG: hypothetical protein FWG72_05350 [Oscillospiraceae bacterium]|nr:hypothetical protein [Oscillospiraceae bacterium]
MSDKKWDAVKTLIISAAIVAAAAILGDAIKQAGWHIFEGLSSIGSSIVTSFPQ